VRVVRVGGSGEAGGMRVCRLGAGRPVLCEASECLEEASRPWRAVRNRNACVFESGVSASRIPPQRCELIIVGV
jgi:hypothetical protein